MGERPPVAWYRRKRLRPYIAAAAAVTLGAGAAIAATAASASTEKGALGAYHTPQTAPAYFYHAPNTATPIKHLVVIFDENESFDHYFGTYPFAANTDGTAFHAKPGTPTVNGLYTRITKNGPVGPLLTSNTNLYQPQRLTPGQALTSSQNHGDSAEQKALDGGKMDAFVQNTENHTCSAPQYCPPGIVMDYYDGNTVTALWNYAQNYAMSENNWDTNFGPSSVGALNVISGNTGGAQGLSPQTGQPASNSSIAGLDSNGVGSVIGDPDPYYDQCSNGSNHSSTNSLASLSGKNIGDLLNAQHVTWGWFQGGFAPSSSDSGGAICGSSHQNIGGAPVTDYVPHHEPFQYYASTANPGHLPPSSASAIGRTDQANHQYDISDFSTALSDGNMPSVSYLKPPAYQNGHPGNSDPIDEQHFVVAAINQIEKSKYWDSTAIVITYDDSDGWYDHVAPKIVNGSSDAATDSAVCTAAPVKLGSRPDRCGYSQRLPMLVISPYTRTDYVSGNLTDTSSVVKFIEDNWLRGQRLGGGSFDAIAGSLDARGGLLNFQGRPDFTPVILDPTTGAVVGRH
jgi:phospholipase C